ncbi:hypothetical protein TNCV_3665921 [Trichonephila clavipes]|uniref:Uncharacterized protein n=1 Tax=Trichonephila clavipes TaxID=2585209 RepID=A0A8X6VF17_TRICX|nr:hypothetical protein TNCV_3665921 [Trichonephila clavipes]
MCHEFDRSTTKDTPSWVAFSDFSENVRGMIFLGYFVNRLKDEKIQKALNVRTRGDVASRAGSVVNQGISEVAAPETIRKIAAPSAGGAVQQGT